VYLALIVGVCPSAWSQLKIQAVVNAASFQPGVPDVGGLVSIFVSGLAGTPGLHTASSALPLPSTLAGIIVTVNGLPAPILAVYIPPQGQSAYGQINIQVPIEWNTSASTGQDKVVVSQQSSSGGVLLDSFGLVVVVPRWGGFFSDQNGFAIAQHAADYSTVTSQNPAHAGETILVYATGFFRVWPPSPVGFPAPQQPLFLSTDPIPMNTGYLFLQSAPQAIGPGPGGAFLSGSCADTPAVQVTFEGLAPGLVGVEQINFVVPANQQPGDWTLFFNTGTSADGKTCDALHSPSSSPYVKLPVR